MKIMREVLGKVISFFKYIINLETTSMAGRYNIIGTLVLVLFVLAYTVNDAVCYFISSVEDTIKTCVLGENIDNTYQTVNVLKVLYPVFIGMVLCMLYLVIDDKKKKDIAQQEETIKDEKSGE